jgi:membrane-associated phospholipid phosphatase
MTNDHTRPEPLAALAHRAVPLVWFLAVSTAVLVPVGFVLRRVEPAWDLAAIEWLAERRTPGWDRLAHAGNLLAETVPVLVLTLLAVAAARRWTGGWTWPAVIGLAVGCEKLVYLVTSLLVGRARPAVPTLGETYATSSFPSGHVASAASLYGSIVLAVIVWRRWPAAARLAAVGAAAAVTVIVAFARTYRGFHYLSDAVAGALLGVVWVVVAWWAFVHRPQRTAVAPEPAPSGGRPEAESSGGCTAEWPGRHGR